MGVASCHGNPEAEELLLGTSGAELCRLSPSPRTFIPFKSTLFKQPLFQQHRLCVRPAAAGGATVSVFTLVKLCTTSVLSFI